MRAADLLTMMRLIRGLFSGETAFSGPPCATVDVTRRCNLHCLGCRYHSPALSEVSPGDQSVKDISVNLFHKLCNELSFMGTQYMVLIGEGEPLLHPRLAELIHIAKDQKMHVSLLSNGVLLDDQQIKQFVEARLDVLKVSLWGNNAEEYGKNHPRTASGYFNKILTGLKRTNQIKNQMQSRFPRVIIHQPITRHNFQGIVSAVDLLQKTGSDVVSFSPLKTWHGALDAFALTADEEAAAIRVLRGVKRQLESLGIPSNIDEVLLRYGKGEAVWKVAPCYMGWLNSRIKVDGTVLPCEPCLTPMGNVQETNFGDIWNGTAYKHFRRKTRTREDLAKMVETCDCGFCCHLAQNLKVHRIFRWFLPIANRKWKT